MKKASAIFFLFLFACGNSLPGEEAKTSIVLAKPDKTRGLPLMQALDVRASTLEWSAEELNLQDLSDLVWAANGVNRPAEGKRTASSAQNAQDIDVYVFMASGIYLYEASKHVLNLIVTGDYRPLTGKTEAPITIVLISDISRFVQGYEEYAKDWANIDCGIVSQNISLFCAATGLKTRPRAFFETGGKDKIRQLLNLKDTQLILLNHPVGYAK
jgi:nitroreductase